MAAFEVGANAAAQAALASAPAPAADAPVPTPAAVPPPTAVLPATSVATAVTTASTAAARVLMQMGEEADGVNTGALDAKPVDGTHPAGGECP